MSHYKSEHEAVNEANRRLFADKMAALKKSKNLDELVHNTPGASASVRRENGKEEVIARGPKDTSDQPIKDWEEQKRNKS